VPASVLPALVRLGTPIGTVCPQAAEATGIPAGRRSLDSGHLFGAAFDVFAEEPIPAGSRLLSTPNIVMTPHLAGASKETAAKAARIVAGDVGRYLRGEPLAHCANPSTLNTSTA
jgi:phosphoglycerate dehydrogenase-like enzyme